MTDPESGPETVAAVDLGSNSFHMIVAQPIQGQMRVIDRLRETVRLAAGLDADNNLTDEARERALDCLGRFGQRLRDMPAGSVRAVGTNTLRKARNASGFLARAAEALGHPVEVIAGREEARLIYLGVSHSLPDTPEHHLVVDIGGGSTEAIIGKRFEALERESFYMGCVSYSRAYFPDGRVTAAAMKQAVMAARIELEPVENDYRRMGWQDAIGASGTIKAVRQVVEQSGWSDGGVTLASLRRLRDVLVSAGDMQRVELAGLRDDRRPVFPGGVAVLLAIFEALGLERMQVSDWALREGLLYDLVGRIRHEDVRQRTIASMAIRYNVDAAQAQRVEQTALALLQPVDADWSLEGECAASLLAWGAQLHELGLGVAHNQHHKHAAYLIENSDMPGFSREEQRMLALLVRAHRRKFPLSLLKALPKEQNSRLQRIAVLLRVAVSLHRSRSDNPLPVIGVSADDRGLTLRFPDGWLADHPLTAADLQVEADYLKASKLGLAFS